MEATLKVLDLPWGQPGSVAAQPLVDQGGAPSPAVGSAPFHEAGTAAPGNVHDLDDRVAAAV
jgi:hypothetical protein